MMFIAPYKLVILTSNISYIYHNYATRDYCNSYVTSFSVQSKVEVNGVNFQLQVIEL